MMFEALYAKIVQREDADLLFVLLSIYAPSAVCAPFARYLDIKMKGTEKCLKTLR